MISNTLYVKQYLLLPGGTHKTKDVSGPTERAEYREEEHTKDLRLQAPLSLDMGRGQTQEESDLDPTRVI